MLELVISFHNTGTCNVPPAFLQYIKEPNFMCRCMRGA